MERLELGEQAALLVQGREGSVKLLAPKAHRGKVAAIQDLFDIGIQRWTTRTSGVIPTYRKLPLMSQPLLL